MFLRKTEGFKMSYVKLTNYAIKDALLTGDPNKIVKGADIDAEFNAIATASTVTDAAYVAADIVVAATAAAATALKLSTSTAATTYAPLASAALTGVPTAPTATVGTNTTQIATMAALLNQAFTSALPAQTGNSGKFVTTDGTTASWAQVLPTYAGNTLKVLRVNAGETGVEWVSNSGIGGTTSTASLTLTSTSDASMVITPASYGLYATLPDATTMSEGMSQFAIYNAGDYDYGVKNSAGTILGWIKPLSGGYIGLASNGSSAGVWSTSGLSKIGVTAGYVNVAAITNSSFTAPERVTVDSTREAFFFGTSGVYVVIYDSSTNSFGTAYLVRASADVTTVTAVLSATNQILVTSSITTAFEAVTLTLAGTVVTVNTAATDTLAGNFSAKGVLVAVGSSFVGSYSRNTNTTVIRGFSISGTTVTIGTEETQTAVSLIAPIVLISGTSIRVLSISTTFIYCKPYTISGAVLTGGTEASAATTATGLFRGFINGNTNVVAEYQNTTQYASIFKLTGTVMAVSSVQLTANTSVTNNLSGYSVISASKTFFTSYLSTSLLSNVLTDSSGTASVGTAVLYESSATHNNIYVSPSNGNNTKVITAFSSTGLNCVVFESSGTSPTITKVVRAPSPNIYQAPSHQSAYGVLAPTMFSIGTVDYFVGTGLSSMHTYQRTEYINLGIASTPTIRGASNTISWSSGTTQSTTAGLFLFKIEVAA